MHLAAAFLLFFSMVFGVDEPANDAGSGAPPVCAAERASPSRVDAPRRATATPRPFGAEIRNGKVIFTRAVASAEGGRVQRFVLHELTESRFSWEWVESLDGGRTWQRIYGDAYRVAARPA